MIKIRNAQLEFFGLLLFIVLIIYLSWGLIFFDENLQSNQSALCETKREEFFKGKVSDVYLSWKTDTLNVFTFKITVNNKEKLIYNYCLIHPENYIEKGDSIYKEANSFEYHIYKGGDPSQEEVIRCEDNYCDKWK